MRTVIVAAALLAGCAGTADIPQTLSRIPPPADPGTLADRPAYGAVDRPSFEHAALMYPATAGGEHRVPVGDYLLGRVLESLNGDGWRLVRLRKLDARCVDSGFWHDAICSARLELQLNERTVTGTVQNLKVGKIYVVRDQLILTQVQYSDAPIQKEARTVIDAVLADALR